MKRRGWGLRAACALLLALLLTATALADELALEPVEQPVEELPELDLGEVLQPEADAPALPAQEAIVPDGGIILPEETVEPADEAILPEETVEPGEPAADPEPEPVTEPESEPTADPEPEPVTDPEPEPTADPDAQVMAPEPAEQASGLRLNAESLALGLGERFLLTPQAASPDGAPVTYRFASSNRKVAKVSAAGVVTAKKRGGAVITVAASTGETATCAVWVFKAPTSVKLNAKAAVLGFDAGTGAGMQFALQPRLSRKSASAISYYGYDSRVVSVSAQGVITAKGVGRTRITARTYNNKKAKIWITVLPAPKTFALEGGLPQLCVQERRALAARLPVNTAASVRFASDNPAVASVDAATGEITGLAVGEATVTATAFNGVSAAFRVRVLPGPDSVAISETTHLLGRQETFRLTAVPRRADGGETTATVRYVTSNRKVAAVAADGTVKGKKKGSAVITAIAPNGAKAECRVTVWNAPASIRLNAKNIWMQYDAKSGLGAQFQLTPKITRGSVSKISYTGYNAAVVSVSPSGLVTAVGVGATTITARTYNGKKAKCKVTVSAYSVAESGYRAGHPLQVMAHRGGAGYWPENTLEAFSKAGSKGADGVELDVFTSSDGVEFVYHSLNMKVNGKKYNVTKCTMAQLRKLKPDICTLDEALKVVAGSGMKLWLDLKAGVDGADCVAAVRKWGLADRTVYVSFNLDRLALVRAADASARLSYTFEGVPANLSKIIADYKLYGVSPGTGCITRALVDAWHRAGLVVGVWTPNEIMQIKALRDMGVDVICTDYPDRADAVR